MCKYIIKIYEREVSGTAQMAIYIEDKLAERLDKAVKASGKSKSKWVADAIEYVLRDQWPEGFFDLAGKWEDDVGPGEIMKRIRNGMEKLDARKNLFK
jgi:predicted DNA-binding protein